MSPSRQGRRRPRWVGAAMAAAWPALVGGAAAPPPAESGPANAESEPERPRSVDTGLEELTLEELLGVRVTTPTRTEWTLRECPGVVTVLTREEIRDSGARDLIDVLLLVPGFSFGLDVQGAVGLGFRGNWGEEGKILILVDGQEVNESLYLTYPFGNHVPLEHVERIEIVRGPGSVVHGGLAELAVISIVTRGAHDLDGASVTGYAGEMEDGLGRRNLSLYAGHTFEEADDLSVSFSGVVGEGRRSDATYRDFFGNEYSLAANSRLAPLSGNLAAAWRGWSLRVISDELRTTTRDALDVSAPEAVRTDFTSRFVEARYDARLTDGLVLTPKVNYARHTPWQVLDLDAGRTSYYDKTAERWLGSLLTTWDAREWLRLLFGGEARLDRAWLNDGATAGVGFQQPFVIDEGMSTLRTVTGFAQAEASTAVANVALGARGEYSDHFGRVFLPRAAVTKAFDRLHLKLLYARAYRAPGHENLALNHELRPELTTTWELETGYQVAPWLFVDANLFDITIDRPIIYTFRVRELYANYPQTGTRGVETGVRVRHRRAWAGLSYSFYTPDGKNDVETYAIPGRDDVVRGFAPHKVAFRAGVPLARGLSLDPSAVWLAARYGAVRAGPGGEPIDGREGPTTLLNVFASWRDVLAPGLELGAGVFNLLDQSNRYLQAHASGHAPLPGTTREWVARLAYTYEFGGGP